MSRSIRLARWWTRRYTAGLDARLVADRREAIDGDLVEHERYRREQGWTARSIAVERLERLVGGMASDLAWRAEVLRARPISRWSSCSAAASSITSMVLGVYVVAFGWYVHGNVGLADRVVLGRTPLGGFHHYGDEAGGAVLAASILLIVGASLLIGAIARPISPVVANAAAMPIAALAVAWFWLGVWPLGLAVLVCSFIDLAIRSPRATPP